MASVTFQQGVDGYSATYDTMLRESKPQKTYETAANVNVDGADSAGKHNQGLLEFGNLFGNGPGQIPLGATITSATLTLNVSDATPQSFTLNRMLIDWSANSAWTWNSFGNGIQADGTEARSTADGTFASIGTGNQGLDVTQSLQAWSSGAANFGWAILMDGSNGWDFSSSEGPVAPKLTVDYITTSTAGLLVTETGGSTTVTEGGQGDSFLVALKSAPTANVTITIAGNPDVDAGPTTLTFTPGNWQTAQTVTLTALDDAVVEGTEVKNVGLSSASADASYDGLSASVSTTILDNDTPPPPAGLVVTETGGSTTVAEGGQGDSILVALKSAPAADVTITIAGNPDVDRDPAILTFTAANWQTAQSVALTAVDDTLVEGTEVKTVGLSSASADPSYDGLSTSISTTILDNDTQGELTVASVTFQQGVDGYNSTYDTMLRESKPTSSYKSAANVNVDGVDSAGKHNQGLLEFGNLFGNGPGQIPLGATITSATLTLNVSDATPQSFTLNRMLIDWSANSAWTWNSFGNGIQADGTEARSTADGTFASIGTGNQGLDVTQSLQAWSSGAANFGWAILMDGSNGWDFSSSEGPVAPKLTVDYIITSTAGLLVTETGGSTTVTEGGQGDSFFVALKSAPTANVTITIAGNPDVDAGPTTLTFTPGNWQTAQTVTLTALDDAVVEGTEVKNVGLSSASADASYDGLSASVSTTILDNDTPPPPAGLVVTETGGSTTVAEGGQGDSFLVALKSAPTANVTITITGNPDVDRDPATLMFTPANWQTAQTVTLTAVDDALVEGTEVSTVGLSSGSVDASYNGLSASVSTTILDNDTPPPPAGLVVTETGGSTTVTEGGQGDSILVALTSAPTADVTVTVPGNADVNTAPATLTFTAANWQTAQSVALTAVNDTLVEGTEVKTIALTSTSSDAGFNQLGASFNVTVIDNDFSSPFLVQVHDTTQYKAGDPTGYGSCDPSGLAYVPELNLLLMADLEHDESPFFSPTNLFSVRPGVKPDGTPDLPQVSSYSLTSFTKEPTGLAYNPYNHFLYITDDDARKVFWVDPNNPSVKLGEFSVKGFGITDAEDPAFGTNGNIYVLNGVTQHIFELTPNGSSLVRSVALPSVITDAEGLAYDAASDIFYVASGKTKGKIFALDHDMHLISTLDLLNDPSYRNPTGGISPKIKGLELAPSSDPNDGNHLSLYAADYGSDQKADGRLFEIDLAPDWPVA